jgi:hypothetical protein
MNLKQEIPCSGLHGSTEPIPLNGWKNEKGYFVYELPYSYCVQDYESELCKLIYNSSYFNELPLMYQKNKEFIKKAIKYNKKILLQLPDKLRDSLDT